MINTRRTIFKTLKKRIRELTKHANLAPLEFKKIMIAVILNDLKEWSEYIPKDDPDYIVKLLNNYIINNCFILDRMQTEDNLAYVNTNTPQTNDTWSRIWDKKSDQMATPEFVECGCDKWTPDSSCEVKIIYFTSVDKDGNPIANKTYLESVYGKCGQKLKTICDKMNVFIDRETGIGWYLTTDCNWERIGSKVDDGMTQEEVEALIAQYRINREWITDQNGSRIELTLVKDSGNNTLDLLTKDEVEAMI